jgi:hypothetical protein
MKTITILSIVIVTALMLSFAATLINTSSYAAGHKHKPSGKGASGPSYFTK